MVSRPSTLIQHDRAVWVLIISGILGFRVGMVGLSDWQFAVETAQVVAGVVTYPAPTPFYVYHTKLWTVLHQICALLLLVGVPEITLSKIVSGLLGMASFQAVSLCVYALSQDALLAIGTGFVILLSRAAEFGAAYPVLLIGTSNTYGIAGLSTIVLTVGLVGAGWYRAGAFLLGTAPAIHPSLGVWLALIVVVCFAWDARSLRTEFRPALKWFLAGCGLTLLSLLLQLSLTYDAPRVAPEIAERYLAAFVGFWDGHRRPLQFVSAGAGLNIGALALALIWLRAFADDVPRPALFLLRVVVVSALLSLMFIVVSWIPPDRVPATLLILMPGRLLNFDVMIFGALLVGLIGIYRDRTWGKVLMLFLLSGLLLGNRSFVWTWLGGYVENLPDTRVGPLPILWLAAGGLVLCAAVSRRHAPTATRAASMRPALTIARDFTLIVLVLSGVFVGQLTPSRSSIFRDWTNDAFFAEVAKGTSLLLTGGDLRLIQLRTRRPVLLDGGQLDGLPYSLEAGPQLERILRDVYSVDFFHPPEEFRALGVIVPEFNQMVWAQYSPQKWREIKRSYHVSQVLTPAAWALQLPAKARDRSLVLYEIPD